MVEVKIDVNSLPEAVEIVGIGLTRQVFVDGEYLDPIPSQKICNHSPDGFNWGFLGSGPSQLALALCEKFLGREEGERMYRSFVHQAVSSLPEGNFRVKINFKKWYINEAEYFGIPHKPRLKPEEFIETMSFELEDSGMKVMDSLTFTPRPSNANNSENPLL